MYSEKLIPKLASHRTADLFSVNSSLETKASAARWLAEVIIKEFLFDAFAAGDDHFSLSLGSLIAKLRHQYDAKILDALTLVKTVGDKASHYNPAITVSSEEVRSAIEAVLNLYPLILIDHLKKYPLNLNCKRATILSVLPPETRLSILSEIINFHALNEQYHVELLHKWCLACVKSGKREKARRKLRDLLKRKKLHSEIHDYEVRSINAIFDAYQRGELPVARNHRDFARNFNEVKRLLTSEDMAANSVLIKLLESMVKNVEPSSMGRAIGMKIFYVG
jgi:hypothetical protein